MIETVLRICGVAVIALISSMLMKERYKSASALTVFAAVVLILAFSLDNDVRSAVDTVSSYVSSTDFSEYALVLMKALGVGYITSVTENICRDAGEGSLASSVEFAGKVQLLILALPLVSSLLDVASKLV